MSDTSIEHSDQKRADMIRKVQALWARADHPNTPAPEAASCREKAADLMARYQIDEITLSESGSIVDDLMASLIRVTNSDRPKSPIADQIMELVHAISRTNDCKGVLLTRGSKSVDGARVPGGQFYQVIGFRKDIAMVQELFSLVVPELYMAIVDEPVRTHPSFAYGFAHRLEERLWEVAMRRKVIATSVSNSMALAVVGKSGQVEAYFNEKYPPESLTNAKVRNFHVDPNAAEKGKRAADKVDIGGSGRVEGGSASRKGLGA